VVQGSVIGLLMFLMYNNKQMISILDRYGIKIKMFAVKRGICLRQKYEQEQNIKLQKLLIYNLGI